MKLRIKIFGLGGLNENGKNMYVVEVENDLFVLDAGLKYPDDRLLGIDYVIPNYDYLKENEDRIKGIFITHGHDGQMGAIPDMLSDMSQLNVYGTAFTLEILKNELSEEQMKKIIFHEVIPHKNISFGKTLTFPKEIFL